MTELHVPRRGEFEKSMALRALNQQVNGIECANNMPICLSKPIHLGLDISSACNINCIFCLAEKGRMRRSDPAAFRPPEWLDHFAEMLPYVDLGIFSSYEALLNPNIDVFAKKMRRHFTPFRLFTNGKALVPEMSEFLLRCGLSSVWCSFHAVNKRTYEGIMRGSDYDGVLQNLMSLKHLARRINPQFRLTMAFCAMRRNIEELARYVDLAHRVGATDIQVNYLLVTNAEHGLDHEAMVFHRELYDYHVMNAKLEAAKLGILLNHQPTFFDWRPDGPLGPCARPWQHLNVARDGTATVCCGGAKGVGNLFTDGFHNVWNGEIMQAFRRRVNSANPPAACKACTRGRENPNEVKTHLTYLRGMTDEQVQERLEKLGLAAPRAMAANA